MLLTAEGFWVEYFVSAEQFLCELSKLRQGVIISDVCMPGMNGIEFLKELEIKARQDPLIVITGNADVPMAVKAFKSGAFDFIEKPFDATRLTEALAAAFGRCETPCNDELRLRIASLSKREREVFEGLIDGATNKRIAINLGISPRTVEIYRGKLMEKMDANSLSKLVRMGVEAGLANIPQHLRAA
jgi:two-component system response regulator FixJ